MGTVGTFDGFTTARLGIYAAQKGLSVTGHNIANLNTEGFTRQRVDQVSLKTGSNDMYRSQYDNHVGNGVLIKSISQIRDPYLDIRYRNVTSDVGYSEAMLKGLQDIASILDEVNTGIDGKQDGMLYAQLQDLRKELNTILSDPTNSNDNLARTSANSLVSLFNTYAQKLETLKANAETGFKDQVTSVNEILTNIRNLNESIRECDIHGDAALEMRDERNRQIDALAKYMHIKVTYSMEDIGAGQEVEKLTISLGDSNPDPAVTTDSSVLVDGIYGAQIDVPKTLPVANPNFDPINGNPFTTDDPPAEADALYLAAGGGFTNDPAQAEQTDNKNYLIHIGKLLDSKEREWTSSKTTWEDATGGIPSISAVYNVKINASAGWAAGDTFTLNGQTFTVGRGGDINVADANNPDVFATFIARQLNGSADYADYAVTAQGDTIVFTARNSGAVGGNGPAAAPAAITLTANPPAAGGTATGSITFNPMDNPTPGVDGVAPGADSNVVNPDGSETTIYYREVATNQGNKWFKITIETQHTYEVTLDDNDLYGSFQAARELLTEQGEFATADDVAMDENATTKRGIPYYQKSLDLLARQLAEQFNKLNQGFMVNQKGNYIDETGKELLLAGQPISKSTGMTQDQKDALIADGCTLDDGSPDLNRWLEANNALVPKDSGVLFSNRGDNDDGTGITAANIAISNSWSKGDTHIVNTFIQLFGEDGKPTPNSTQVENAGHMVSLIDKSLDYDPKQLDPNAVGSKLFTGSFNDMFSNTATILGNDQRTINVQLNTHYASQVEIDFNREGVSGVDLNDEAMNMMQFQKAYSAACRLMTAIDEALDRLINNTGLAGR